MIQDSKRLIIYLLLAIFYLAALATASISTTDPSSENSSLKSQSNSLSLASINSTDAAVNVSLSSGLSQTNQTAQEEVKIENISKSEDRIKLIVQSSGNLSSLDGNNTDNITGNATDSTIDSITGSTADNVINKTYSENATISSERAVGNTTVPQKAKIAAYVYNDDDDTLDVDLFIDSVPKGKVEVAKGKQETFGNYTLTKGAHRFKIIWNDPSPKKVYESELNEEITGDDAVSLYTTEHTEPDKFDLSVSVKNENDKSTNAYLYIDGKYEKSKELSESGTTEFDKVSVEEGVHDVSIRWLDPYTNAEYEKKKRVTIDDDKAVIFVATKGVSFEDKGEVSKASEEDTPTEDTPAKTASNESSVNSETTGTEVENRTDTNNNTSNSTDSTTTNTTNAVETANTGTNDSIKDENPSAIRTLSIKESSIGENTKPMEWDWSNISIVYLLVLLAAVYLVFRR